MVTLDINFGELQKELGKSITLEKLEEKLFDMGMELDSAEGDELKIDITPDRPDMVSLHGLLRALKAYMGIKKGMPKYTVHKSDVKIKIDKSVRDVRPYTVAAVVKNLKFDDAKIKEMIWVQEKLHDTFARNRKKGAIGIYPFETIKPPIHYFAEDPKKVKFQPLEFMRELTGLQILSQHPAGRDYGHLLEGKNKFPFFKDSNNEILSMPPIINSHKTGKVSDKTTEIFIECSGHDLKSLNTLLNILVTMFADMGGKVCTVELQYPDRKMITPNLSPEKRTITLKEINDMIGHNFTAKQAEDLLRRMLYDAKAKKERIELLVPAIRSDIWHNVDVVDDVARAYGLNNFKPTLKPVATMSEQLPMNEIKSDLSELMIGLGYNGAFTLSLTSESDQYEKMNIEPHRHMKLGQTAEKSINMIRTWLLPELVKVLVNNRNKNFPQKVFEAEDVIIPDDTKDVMAKNVTKMAALTSHSSANFTEIKQAVDYLMDSLGLEYEIEEISHQSFIEGRAGSIIIKGKSIGVIGELSPLVLSNWELEMPAAAFEIDISELRNILK